MPAAPHTYGPAHRPRAPSNPRPREQRSVYEDFTARTIPVFPDLTSGVRLVDVTTGEEIKPGQTIPEPRSHGRITYLGQTDHTHKADATPRPGRRRPLHQPRDRLGHR